jgi:hypothetical protein
MASPRGNISDPSSPTGSSSPSTESFSPTKEPLRRSSSNQNPSDQSTASLAKVLAERSEILPQTMFGGLVDASSYLKAEEPKEKQKLTWIKVEPGTK